MHDEVELAPQLFDFREDRVDRLGLRHVAAPDNGRAKLRGERTHALFERLDLIGERELGAGVGAGLCDAPGDRAIIGDAQNEALFSGENSGMGNGGLSHQGVRALRLALLTPGNEARAL